MLGGVERCWEVLRGVGRCWEGLGGVGRDSGPYFGPLSEFEKFELEMEKEAPNNLKINKHNKNLYREKVRVPCFEVNSKAFQKRDHLYLYYNFFAEDSMINLNIPEAILQIDAKNITIIF